MPKIIDIKKSDQRVKATIKIEEIKLNNNHMKRVERIGRKEINVNENIAKYIRRVTRWQKENRSE